MNKCFLISSLNSSWCNLRPLPLVLSWRNFTLLTPLPVTPSSEGHGEWWLWSVCSSSFLLVFFLLQHGAFSWAVVPQDKLSPSWALPRAAGEPAGVPGAPPPLLILSLSGFHIFSLTPCCKTAFAPVFDTFPRGTAGSGLLTEAAPAAPTNTLAPTPNAN